MKILEFGRKSCFKLVYKPKILFFEGPREVLEVNLSLVFKGEIFVRGVTLLLGMRKSCFPIGGVKYVKRVVVRTYVFLYTPLMV